MESHRRSIAKAISWRFIAIIITAVVAWVITGEIRYAAMIGIADSILKIAFFYQHERIWNRIKFGYAKETEHR